MGRVAPVPIFPGMPSIAEDKRWRSLKRRKGRTEHGLFLAEGVRLLEDLLASELEVVQLLHTSEADGSARARAVVERCREQGVPAEQVAEGELQRYADTVTPQGLLAVARVPQSTWDELPVGDVVVLDAVQDPGNAGTVLRTAEALGAVGAVALPGTVDVWNPKVVRASAGSVFRMPVIEASREDAVERLRGRGGPIWASDAGGEPFSRGDPVPREVALVLGNEGSGVGEELLAAADRRVAIPLPGGAESLNVAVASAILMDRIFAARRTDP